MTWRLLLWPFFVPVLLLGVFLVCTLNPTFGEADR
jgi:hypothetical protein